MRSSNFLYPLGLLTYNGVMTYFSDTWNVIEFSMYSLFMVAFYCKEEGGNSCTEEGDFLKLPYLKFVAT
eukprot:COSAG06_NODE_18348_length_892_cov_0.905422_2_plen_68_part_01